MTKLLASQPKLFLLALSFFTRIPSPIELDYQDLPRATVYLPVVGWVVGGICALSFYLANLLWSQESAVMLAIITGILLTGALHEDGFADVCDGFGGGYGKQRILEIMKDSHIGVYGVVGLLCLLILKFSVLSALPLDLVPWAILAGHTISRLLPLFIMREFEYARTLDSKAAVTVYRPSTNELGFAGGCAVVPLIFMPASMLILVPLIFINYCLGRYFYLHIGGYTGDCLGTSQQLAEVVFYLGLQALWTFI